MLEFKQNYPTISKTCGNLSKRFFTLLLILNCSKRFLLLLKISLCKLTVYTLGSRILAFLIFLKLGSFLEKFGDHRVRSPILYCDCLLCKTVKSN